MAASSALMEIIMAMTPTARNSSWTISMMLLPEKSWTARTSSMQRVINWPDWV